METQRIITGKIFQSVVKAVIVLLPEPRQAGKNTDV
jgi:hypothetical protein